MSDQAELDQFRYAIREAIEKIDTHDVDREDVAEVLKEERISVLFGDKENEHWLKDFEEVEED